MNYKKEWRKQNHIKIYHKTSFALRFYDKKSCNHAKYYSKNDGIELTADFVVISSPLLISYSVYFSSTKKKKKN